MGKKQLKLLLILLVVIGAAAAVLTMMQSGKVEKVKSITEREDLIEDFPINDVAELEIETEGGVVSLKKSGNNWTVVQRDGYAAKTDSIERFLKMIWALKIVQNVEVGEAHYGRLHLATSEDKKEGQIEKTIRFNDKDGKILHALLLGKIYERMENQSGPLGGGPKMNAVGRYVRLADEEGVFLVGETFATIDADPSKWLDEKFFKIEHIKAIEIKTGKKENDWKLTRDKVDQEFVLVDVKKDEDYDPSQANALKNAFVGPRFEDVIVGDEAKKKLDNITFLIDTAAGFHYIVNVGDKNELNEYLLTFDVDAKFDDKRAPVKDESEEDKKKRDEEFSQAVEAQKKKLAYEKSLSGKVFKVRSYVIDTINKKRADLMKQAGPPAGAGAPGAGFPGMSGLPGAGGPGGISPEMLKKLMSGAKMPGGHPPVKRAAPPVPIKKPGTVDKPEKPAAKIDEDKKPAIKAAKPTSPSDAKKEAKGEAEKPAPKKAGE